MHATNPGGRVRPALYPVNLECRRVNMPMYESGSTGKGKSRSPQFSPFRSLTSILDTVRGHDCTVALTRAFTQSCAGIGCRISTQEKGGVGVQLMGLTYLSITVENEMRHRRVSLFGFSSAGSGLPVEGSDQP